ncbi:MAG: SIMPL domain-containing protein [Firmicutes bacterium]|nr:SIMPL domain-containing protein [Bacillota bacterium]
MQRKVWVHLTLVVLLLTVCSGLVSASSDTFTIKVQATGVVYVPPTKAQMWIGARTDGLTAEEALTQSNQVMQGILEIVEEFTSPELIKTSEFNMYQKERWDDVTQQSVPEGFTLRHVFEVQIHDLSKVAPFLDRVTQAGANIIYGLQYGVQDNRTPREQAYRRAMEEAWWKANLLADANGTKNLALENVEESYSYTTTFDFEEVGVVEEKGDSLMPGQLQVSVTLEATFRAQFAE